MFKASPFKLNMYKKCPRRYKFYYIDGLAQKYKKPRPYLTMGSHVHDTLRIFFQYVNPEGRSLAKLHQILRQRWAKNREGFKNIEEEKEYGEKALKMLTTFFNNNDITVKPLMVEDYHSVIIDEELELGGKIDRVDKNADGTISIIDYKTGKKESKYEQSDFSHIQLISYCWILNKKFNYKIKDSKFLFLLTNEISSITLNNESLNNGLRQIKTIIDDINCDSKFVAKTSILCNFCDFLEICEDGKQNIIDPKTISIDDLPF